MRLSVSVEDYYRYRAPKTLELIDAGNSHWRTICPFCNHHNEKFYIDKSNGLYHCFHCDVGGTIVKYHALLKGISTEDAAKELGDAREIKPEIAIISELYVAKLHKDLKENFLALEQLKKSWHLNDSVIDKFKIGLKDGNTICIPIFNNRGDCVNIRYKKLWKQPGEKSIAWSHSDPEKPNLKFGSARLFPIDTVVSERVIFLCAGEKDCLSSISMGITNAVTTTGGEGTFKDEYAFDLAGKKVYILYDTDSTGYYSAKKVYEALKNIADVEIINLPKMPAYDDGTIRKDITDYWNMGKSLEDFYIECNIPKEWKEKFHDLPQLLNQHKALPSIISESEIRYTEALAPTFVDNYCAVSRELINSPTSYHRLCGLWVASNLLGRNCVFIDGVSDIFANLWILILGATTKFHKSTTMEFAKDILLKVDEDAIASTAFTPQGFWKRLKDRQNSCLTSAIYYDEVAGMFDQMRADYNAGGKENLIRLYDGQTVRYDRSHDSININTSYVTFLGGGIPSRMSELLSWRDIELGFLGRFLVSLETVPNPYVPRSQIDYHMAVQIKNLVVQATKIRDRWGELWKILLRHNEENQPEYLFPNEIDNEQKRYQFYFTPEAQKRFNEFDHIIAYDESINENMHLAAVHARLPSLCKKLATIYCACECPTSFGPVVDIELSHVMRAIRDINIYREHIVNLTQNVGITEIEKTIITIFELVYKNPRIERREIAKAVKLTKKDLTVILDTMIDRGLLRERKLTDINSEYLIGL